MIFSNSRNSFFTNLLWIVIVLLALLCLNGKVQAEGNCPAGYYPIGSTNGQQGPQGCAPIPNYNNGLQQGSQQDPAMWVNQWMAIASDAKKSVLGVAKGMSNERNAKDAALEDCRQKGGDHCKFENAFRNSCAALTVGSKGYLLMGGKTVAEAMEKGMELCKKDGDKTCHIYFSACSLPVRIK